jgi:ABC-type uncharacterized transport system auxiliary subunit
MRRLLVIALAVFVAGCVSSRPADRYFVLEPAAASASATPAATAATAVRLHVAPTTASGFYDTQSIAYSRATGTRAYYQFNHWTERPQHVVHAQLVARLDARPPGSAPLVLATQVEEIYHDAVQEPGKACLAISAELIDPARREVLARRTFRREMPAASYDAAGAVQGLRAALAAVLDDIVAWVAQASAERRP